MRIGLLIYGSLGSLSGGYLYDRQLVSYLEVQGEQVEIISLPWRRYAWHLFDNFSAQLAARLENLRVDVLLQDELNHPSLFHLNHRLKKSTNYPLISIVHHLRSSEYRPAWQNRLYRAIEARYLDSVDGYIFNSDSTRRSVVNLVGETRLSIVAYPAGDRLQPALPDGWIESRGMGDGPLQILFLGNIIPRKGLHTLIEALGRVPDENWGLEIVGSLDTDRNYARQCRQLVRAYQLEEKVRFQGAVDEDELKIILYSSHLMVVPSFYEGFGISYLEGMGFGLPAIGSRWGGAPEIITHGENGYLVSKGDPAELCGYLEKLINDRQLLIKLSRAALERYSQHPTWQATAEKVHAFVMTMTDQHEAI